MLLLSPTSLTFLIPAQSYPRFIRGKADSANRGRRLSPSHGEGGAMLETQPIWIFKHCSASSPLQEACWCLRVHFINSASNPEHFLSRYLEISDDSKSNQQERTRNGKKVQYICIKQLKNQRTTLPRLDKPHRQLQSKTVKGRILQQDGFWCPALRTSANLWFPVDASHVQQAPRCQISAPQRCRQVCIWEPSKKGACFTPSGFTENFIISLSRLRSGTSST